MTSVIMRRNRIWVTCEHCGKILEIIKARQFKFRFCSFHCHAKTILSSEAIRKKAAESRKGAKNGRWKGGRRKHTNGYVWILIDGKYILEHRHVMQQFIGRKLKPREQVHHKNSDKLDNRIENLELVDIVEHSRFHTSQRYR